MSIQLLQQHLLKNLSFHGIAFAPLSTFSWYTWEALYMESLFSWSMCLFFCQYHAIVINCCYIVLKLRISFFIATENPTWILVGILFLTYKLIGENQHLFYGKSYSQWTWYCAPLYWVHFLFISMQYLFIFC